MIPIIWPRKDDPNYGWKYHVARQMLDAQIRGAQFAIGLWMVAAVGMAVFVAVEVFG